MDAEIASGIGLSSPFTAYGFPDEPLKIVKTYGDNRSGTILSFAGFVAVVIEDQYENPIANLPVDFKILDPEPRSVNPDCSYPDQKKAYFISNQESCLFPIWGTCGDTNAQRIQIITQIGAGAEIILGEMPNARYTITATSGDLSATFTRYSDLYCGGTDIFIEDISSLNIYGATVLQARPVGTTIPVKVKLTYLQDGTLYNATSATASVTFDGFTGAYLGDGIFTAEYPLETVGLKQLTAQGSAAIGGETKTATTTINVYGMAIQMDSVPPIFVDEEGYTVQDNTISYTIVPPEYYASSAYVMIYKGEDLITYISSEIQGQGSATISRGFRFDINSTYEAEVVLNYGTGAEIRGEKVSLKPFTFGFIDNVPDYALGGDDKTPDNADNDSDNFFLRQDEDYLALDIYYRILPETLPVTDVKIKIYPELNDTPIETLTGPKAGDNLRVIWEDVRENGNFRDVGFYRVKLEVTIGGLPEPIRTSIEDADPILPGWQCPQDGLGIHDLVYKHRPEVYVGSGETVAPDGPVYPFSPAIIIFW